MIIGLITRRGVVFWNRLAELYRTIAVSASLDHLLPIVSVKNGVRKLAVGVQIDIENEIFQKKIQEKNRKEVKNEKKLTTVIINSTAFDNGNCSIG